MLRHQINTHARVSLDQRFGTLQPVGRFSAPARGWIKAIREGLGMSAEQLGQRLSIKQPSVVALEQSEAKGAIQLATLRRVAQAMDCTLVYALVPNQPLETIFRDRARSVARKRRAAIEHSMLLEDQAVSRQDSEARIDELVQKMNPRRIWDEQ